MARGRRFVRNFGGIQHPPKDQHRHTPQLQTQRVRHGSFTRKPRGSPRWDGPMASLRTEFWRHPAPSGGASPPHSSVADTEHPRRFLHEEAASLPEEKRPDDVAPHGVLAASCSVRRSGTATILTCRRRTPATVPSRGARVAPHGVQVASCTLGRSGTATLLSCRHSASATVPSRGSRVAPQGGTARRRRSTRSSGGILHPPKDRHRHNPQLQTPSNRDSSFTRKPRLSPRKNGPTTSLRTEFSRHPAASGGAAPPRSSPADAEHPRRFLHEEPASLPEEERPDDVAPHGVLAAFCTVRRSGTATLLRCRRSTAGRRRRRQARRPASVGRGEPVRVNRVPQPGLSRDGN